MKNIKNYLKFDVNIKCQILIKIHEIKNGHLFSDLKKKLLLSTTEIFFKENLINFLWHFSLQNFFLFVLHIILIF